MFFFSRIKNLLIPALAMIAAATLCLLRIGDFYFGIDDTITTSCAFGYHIVSGPKPLYFTQEFFDQCYTIEGVMHSTMLDNGNALAYNLLLHFWTKITGFNLSLLHLPSIFFFVMSIPVLYGILKRVTEDLFVIRLSLLLYSCHPFLIFMARQIRGYSLSLFLVLASTYLLMLLLEKRTKTWPLFILYTICICLIPLTHYMFGSIVLAHLAFVAYQFKRGEVDFSYIGKFMISSFFCASILLLWLWKGGWEGYTTIMKGQLKSWQDHPADFLHISFFSFCSYFSNLLSFSGGFPLQFIGARIRDYAVVSVVLGLLLYIGLSGNILTKKYKALFWFIPLFLLFTNLVLVLRSGVMISFYPKYNIVIMPFLVILIAAGIKHIYTKKSGLGFALIALIFTGFSWTYIKLIYQDEFHIYGAKTVEARKESPYPSIVSKIAASAERTDTLVFSSWEYAALYNYSARTSLVQTIKLSEENTIRLKNQGRDLLIFDFDSDKRRYYYPYY